MDRDVFFALHCRLTCVGGSEMGLCSCCGPGDCTGWQVPGWYEARESAKERIIGPLRDMLDDLRNEDPPA